MEKRGLSGVIVTVLLLVLVLGAAVITWSFVSPTLRGSDERIDAEVRLPGVEMC